VVHDPAGLLGGLLGESDLSFVLQLLLAVNYDSLHIFSGRTAKIHDIATLDFLSLQISILFTLQGHLLLILLNPIALLINNLLANLHLFGSQFSNLLNLDFSLLLGLRQSHAILVRLLFEPVQLCVLRLQLLQLFLLLALLVLPLDDQLSVGLLSLAEKLLGLEPLGFADLPLSLDSAVHLSLLLFHLVELVLDVLVFSL